MVRCVHCGVRNAAVFRVFGGTKGALILEPCAECSLVVDPYFEHDFITVFVDLLLLKISAFRHILCNSSNKAYLPRLLALTVLSHSYVEWVHLKLDSEAKTLGMTTASSDFVFYELEWGYYVVIARQVLALHLYAELVTYAWTFLVFGYLSFKSSLFQNADDFPIWQMIEGVALSYCWNLALVPSLVWNHYSTYRILSQLAELTSCSHTLQVCVDPGYAVSICIVICSYFVKTSVKMGLFAAIDLP